MMRFVPSVAVLWIGLANALSAQERVAAPTPLPAPTSAQIEQAVAQALPLLAKGAAGHREQRTCFACHNQTLPILALTTARARGFAVSEEDLHKHLQFIDTFLDKNRSRYLEGRGQGGEVDTAGYALWTLELGGWKPDKTTAAVAEYLLQRNKDIDHWPSVSNRPPSEASPFTATYVALRGLQAFSTPEQKERVEERVAAVGRWLAKTPGKDTEDRVFRLWALKRAGLADEAKQAARALLAAQRPDGGWSQTDSMQSDAYATGSVLVALHQTGELVSTDPAYQDGLNFLLLTQRQDGSWYVRSRSKPFQLYYESGFPLGKDQFISIAASGWATTALALTLPPASKP